MGEDIAADYVENYLNDSLINQEGGLESIEVTLSHNRYVTKVVGESSKDTFEIVITRVRK